MCVFACVSMCVCVCEYVCVCVCVYRYFRERKGEREKDIQRDKIDRQTETDRTYT